MNKLLARKDRKARKDHECDLCDKIIHKGETYEWSKYVCYGTLYEWHKHKACSEVCGAIWDYVDPGEGMSDQEFQDGCCEVCQCFICSDCPKYNNEIGDCEDGVAYCIDKMAEYFRDHELYKDGRNKYGGEIWKIREKVIK